MRTIKVLAVLGLAVALAAVPVLAQREIKLTPPPDANDIRICAAQITIVNVWWTQDGRKIEPPIPQLARAQGQCIEIGFRTLFGTFRVDDQTIQVAPPPNANDVLVEVQRVRIVKAEWTRDGRPIATIAEIKDLELLSIHVDNRVPQVSVLLTVVPTLTQWGLIALAALLMGGMGYMLYRRRPALRPAAP